MLKNPSKALLDKGNDPPYKATRQLEDETSHLAPHQQHAPTWAHVVQATNEGASIPVAATIPVISAPVLPLGLSSVPTASVISPFVTPVPSAGPRVTFPPSMTQFMNDPANLQAIQGFGQVMAMCQQNGGMPFLPATYQEAYHTAWEFAEAETQLRAKREAEHGHKSKPVQVKKEEAPGPSRPRHHYDPVIRVVNTEECQEVRKAPVIPPENPTGQVGRQWSGTYCSYHRSDSHNTSECKSVKGVIRQMIDSGELGKDYLQKAQEKSHQWVRPAAPGNDRDNDRRRNSRPRERQPAPEKEHIGMIFGGPEGFTGDTVEAEGSIVLPVELGSGEKTVWKKMRFIVVDIKWVHNAILGRPGINRVGALISMPHLCMKFHTSGGVGEVKGDQRNARECYARAVKKMTKGVNVISQEITKGETQEKLEPEAETVEIELYPSDSSRMVRIGANLPEDLKAQITRALADFLVEMTGITPDLPVNKPTEQWWEMAVDGASGPRGYGGVIVFTTPEGFKIYHAIVFNFKLTNNEAEYEALAGGLRLAQALKISLVSIKSDSSLIVGIAQIPRAENTDADLLSKLTQYAPEHVSKLARVEILDRASIEKLEVAAITAGSQFDRSNLVGADDHWMYDLMEYLMNGSLPEQDDRARKVKLRAPRFQILDGKLYKRAFGGPLLRCLTNQEAERVIAEVHEGVCAAHQMSRTLSQRIILLGYYWPTIVQDCERYVQKCRTCQVFYKRAHGETPFSLTYGCEARLPIEAEFPTFRESNYQPQQNEEDHLAELNLVEERRMAAEVKMSTYQQVVKKYHDNKVGPRYFQVGDEVLRRREASRPGDGGKLEKLGRPIQG
ncbi:unnamed protein product [Cuscuta campestris]|uniref:RNase H type-1 domain-containing protein n=1 Tax=Cuscuta campestris TaxID=132261 RepID=A0A484MR60_9ASTE|nr:unnamed protein product [Cuscuta campestris]